MRYLLVPILCVLISACASDGEVLEPAELIEFRASATVDNIWKTETGTARAKGAEFFSPHIDESAVYTAGYKGLVKRTDRIKGKEVWSRELDFTLISGVSGDQSRIYLNSFEGHLLALSKESGELLWQQKFSSEALAPPAAALDRVVLRTNDGFIIALRAEDGEELWRYQIQVPVLTLHGYASPLIVPGGVLCGLDDGKVIWQTQLSRAEGRSEVERLVDLDGQIVIDQQFIYAVNYQGRVAQIEPQQGNIVWSRPLSSVKGVAVDDSMVFVVEPDAYLWALDKRTGASMWKLEKLEGRYLTRPLAFMDYVLVGDLEGYLHVLSKFDGSTVARFQIDNSAILTAPQVLDETVYVQSSGGVVRALDIGKLVRE